MWRRAVHQEVGWFDARYRVAGDYDMWLRIAERHPVMHVDETLGLYLHGDGVESTNRDRCTRETLATRALHARRACVEIVPGKYPASYFEHGTERQEGEAPVSLEIQTPNTSTRDPKQVVSVARAHRAAGRWQDAIDTYDVLARTVPALAVPILAEAYDCFAEMPQSRFELYVKRVFDFAIQPGQRVLDIGSGHEPFPLATHLADIDTRGGALPFANPKGLPVTTCDIADMKCFGDRSFDFVYCSHVLEYVDDPAAACREAHAHRAGAATSRPPPAAKTPSWARARASGHRWSVEAIHGVLTFVEYTDDDAEGLGSDLLMQMHCRPETLREKAFSALVLMRAPTVNTMVMWEGDFDWEVRRADGSVESSGSKGVGGVLASLA